MRRKRIADRSIGRRRFTSRAGVTQSVVARLERALVVDLDGVEFRVVSIEDLLSMKRAAGRPQDVADVDALLTVERVKRRMPGY